MTSASRSRATAAPHWFAVLMICCVGLWGTVPAANASNDRIFTGLDETEEEIALFVLGNTLFTFYHEIGHALIHALDLPVVGREEDAVDGFAAVMMIPDEPDDFMDALVISAADGWLLYAAEIEEKGGDGIPFWAEHSLDEQRFFSTACLIVGSDPEGFADYASDVGLPRSRTETCEVDFYQMRRGWRRLLADHLVETRGQGRGQVLIAYQRPKTTAIADLQSFLERSGILEAAAEAINTLIHLPSDIPVTVSSCNVAGAYYIPARRSVVLCYELIAEFERLIVEDIQRGG